MIEKWTGRVFKVSFANYSTHNIDPEDHAKNCGSLLPYLFFPRLNVNHARVTIFNKGKRSRNLKNNSY